MPHSITCCPPCNAQAYLVPVPFRYLSHTTHRGIPLLSPRPYPSPSAGHQSLRLLRYSVYNRAKNTGSSRQSRQLHIPYRYHIVSRRFPSPPTVRSHSGTPVFPVLFSRSTKLPPSGIPPHGHYNSYFHTV